MNEFEEREFWKTISTNIATGASWYKDNVLGKTSESNNPINNLLNAIKNNTSNLETIGLQQEYKKANAQASNMSNVLGFSFEDMDNGIKYQTDSEGNTLTDSAGNKVVDYSDTGTQDYISDMGAISQIVTTNSGDIKEERSKASEYYKIMTDSSLKNWGTASSISNVETLGAENDYYSELTSEETKALRD
jgi:hypothetical protein